MQHPNHPNILIPAARVMGVGRTPALPAYQLKRGDELIQDYGKIYKLYQKVDLRPQYVQLKMVSKEGHHTHRTVPLTAHVAVSWGTFNKRWSSQTGGQDIMAKTGRKVKLAGQIDLHTPINSGVSFQGTVDLTKQGQPLLKGKKKIRY